MLDKKDNVMPTDSRYFAQKAIDAADELWDKGLIDENTIEQWKHEHIIYEAEGSQRPILDKYCTCWNKKGSASRM